MLESRGERPELQILSMPELNRIAWGIHRKKLLVIGARPSNGKSVLAISLAQDLALQGFKVYFVSLEMPAPKIMERMFCMQHCIDNITLLKGGIKKDANIRSAFLKWATIMQTTKLTISDMIGRSWEDVDKVIDTMSSKPDVIIVDHLNEVGGNNDKKIAIEKYIQALRTSAIRNNFALILCSQVNRMSQSEGQSREPQLHQLKGTGAIEEMADQVWLLHWEYHYSNEEKDKNQFQINIAKNRDGMTGYVKLFYQPEYYKLSDWGNDAAIAINNQLATVIPHMED